MRISQGSLCNADSDDSRVAASPWERVKATASSTVTPLARSTPRVRPVVLVRCPNADPLLSDDGAASIVEMLFCTSLVAVVGAGDKPSASPRRLQIVNTKVRPFPACPVTWLTLVAEAINNM